MELQLKLRSAIGFGAMPATQPHNVPDDSIVKKESSGVRQLHAGG